MDQPKKPKKVDPYRGIKYIGYRMSQLPERYTAQDLLRYAKFQLAEKSGRLMKDPIWDEYTVEELLAEFFAHQFVENKELRLRFEADMGDINGDIDDFASWADKKMAEDAKIRDRIMDGADDRISFDPSMVMGDTE